MTRQAVYIGIQQEHIETVRIRRTVRIHGEEVERLLRELRRARVTKGLGSKPECSEAAGRCAAS